MAPIASRPGKLLRATHVALSVGVLGADLALLSLTSVALAGASWAYPAAETVGSRVVAPLAAAALGSGLLLVLLTRYSLLRDAWLTIKLLVTATLNALLLFVVLPALSDAAAGEPLNATRQVLLVGAPAAAVALLGGNVILAIFKPTRRNGATAAARPPAREPV